jgi:hypothetical protein
VQLEQPIGEKIALRKQIETIRESESITESTRNTGNYGNTGNSENGCNNPSHVTL